MYISLPPAEVCSSEFIHCQLQINAPTELGMHCKHNYHVLQKGILYRPN